MSQKTVSFNSTYSSTGDYDAGSSLITLDNMTSSWPNETIKGIIPKYSTIDNVDLTATVTLIAGGNTETDWQSRVDCSFWRRWGYTYTNSDGEVKNSISDRSYGDADINKKAATGTSVTLSATNINDYYNFHSNTSLAGQDVPGSEFEGESDPNSHRYFYFDYNIWDAKKEVRVNNVVLTYKYTEPSLTLNSMSGGSINKSGVHTITSPNQTIICSATPEKNYCFWKWSDGNINNPRTFSHDDLTSHDTTISAIFVPYYTISFNFDEGTTSFPTKIYYSTEAGRLKEDLTPFGGERDSVTLPTRSEIIKTGYTYKGWTGTNISSPTENITLSLKGATGDKAYLMNWEVNYYKVFLEVSPSTAMVDPCHIELYRTSQMNTPYLKGQNVEIPYSEKINKIMSYSQALNKWVLDKVELWTVDASGREVTLESTYLPPQCNEMSSISRLDRHVKYKAIFKLRKYTITPMSSINNSAFFEIDGQKIDEIPEEFKEQGYDYGTEVDVTIFPKYGYKFKGWDDTEDVNTVKKFTITSTLTPTAEMEKIDFLNKASDQKIADSIIEKKIEEYSEIKLSTIGDKAFYNCKDLKFAEIAPENTEDPSISKFLPDIYIGEKAFYGCDKLVSFKLPETCVGIGQNAFEGCSNLVALIIPSKSETLLEFSYDPFGENSFLKGTKILPGKVDKKKDSDLNDYSPGRIYVYDQLIDKYKDHPNWSICSDIFRKISEYPEICGWED